MENEIKLIEVKICLENLEDLTPVAYWKITDGCAECLKPDRKKLHNLVEKFAKDFIDLCNEGEKENE